MLYFWLLLLLLMLAIEAISVNMTTIWFALGSLAALLALYVGASPAVQALCFVVCSSLFLALFIVFFKPSFDRERQKQTPTNADRIIGQEAIVIRRIEPLAGTGQIQVMGQVWSASSADGQALAEGQTVRVMEIQGVRAICRLA